jgi:hypothetical protein
MKTSPKLPKVGSRRGDWVLKSRRRNPDGTFTDKWVLDPTVTLIPNTTHKAYTYYGNNATSPITNPSVAGTEFTSTEYTNIGSDNSVYVTTSAYITTVARYANIAHRFTFDLTAYNTGGNTVTQVEYRWDGYRSVPFEFIVYEKVQHKETTGWVDDYTTIPTSDGAGFERTKVLTNISSILINNVFEFGLIYVGGGTESTGYIYLYSDYVELEVTYTVAVVKKSIMKMDLGPHPRSRLLFTRTLMLKGVGASSSPQPTLWDSWDYLWVAVL